MKKNQDFIKKLLKAASLVCTHAYAPYSNFKVGAALISKRGNIYTGVNVENSSYGLTMCAERTAVFKAISEGEKDFHAIAIYTEEESIYPCGACLQVLSEFSENLIVIFKEKGEIKVKSIKELLPKSFKLKK